MNPTKPTLRAAYYVPWAEVALACGLTHEECGEVEAILEHHYTWGDADVTLADVAVVRELLTQALPTRPPVALLTAYDTVTEGAAYINLEAEL